MHSKDMLRAVGFQTMKVFICLSQNMVEDLVDIWTKMVLCLKTEDLSAGGLRWW